MTDLLVLAEFRCSEDGDAELRKHLDRTLQEARAVEGCLQATVWERAAERRYLFTTMWSDRDAVRRWVENKFHRTILMPGFRRWCTEGSFGEFSLETDHDRARKCPSCGRWSRGRPGWSEQGPTTCRQCGRELAFDPGSAAAGGTVTESPLDWTVEGPDHLPSRPASPTRRAARAAEAMLDVRLDLHSRASRTYHSLTLLEERVLPDVLEQLLGGREEPPSRASR